MHKIREPKNIAKITNKTDAINRASGDNPVHIPFSKSRDHQSPKKLDSDTHNFGKISVFPASESPISAPLKISSPTGAHEQAAHQVERKLPQGISTLGNSITENGKSWGETKLSKIGRQFYQPFVGAAVDRAKFHIGGQADELAKLSKAKALTYKEDIYIPKNKFSPRSVTGRALIGHELAHVAQSKTADPQIFRDDEPHYPSVEEQKKIEKLLGRERRPETTDTTAEKKSPKTEDKTKATPEKEPTKLPEGKNLTKEERKKLATELKAPLKNTIDELVQTMEQNEKISPSNIYSKKALYDMAVKAHKEIYAKFGKYISRKVALTKTKNSVAERIKKDQILVEFSDMSDAANALARTLATTHCSTCSTKLNGLNSESKSAVVGLMAKTAVSERGEFLKKAAKLAVGGSYQHSSRTITLPYSGRNVYHSAVHELIHALAHPAFRAAFGDEDLANEGFTEYFTRKVVSGGSYPEPFSKVKKTGSLMKGPFLFDYGTAGSAEESLRLAYFSGRLDLIGWQPTSEKEKKAVEAAGGAPQWDPKKAKEYAKTYKKNALEKQDSHSNILGVGIYFTPQSVTDPTFTVRYARVLAQTKPYSRGRLLLEGQFIGTPLKNPRQIGGSLGIAAEYQEPYFYATGGVRFIGGATPQGDNARVDFSPFVGVGVRAWQRLRVGAEGFVLFPIVGKGIRPGGGVTVGVEF